MFVSPTISAINVLTNKIVHVGFLCVLETECILHHLLLSAKQQGTTISAGCPVFFSLLLCAVSQTLSASTYTISSSLSLLRKKSRFRDPGKKGSSEEP